jgi:hypothetical protein
MKRVGGVSPLLFIAAFGYASNPGGYQTIHLPCSDLHPQGFTVPAIPTAALSELTHASALLVTNDSVASSLTVGRVVSVPEP